ncbi:hypothetical protein U5A82_14035 [Sphingobium sp. CR2-8]|uniref:DUF2306 domain-containing protein n=1 Tax=Sphingobium sp. CR2-8 TaxID=1306534 RepID=UPI002DBE4311|nr:hypothetical protein [Sphingobium sp. CR2-8]MEC3911542.1 hypothetical protein [Sphingobium sp. CR2-8]
MTGIASTTQANALAPDRYERFLTVCSIILLAVVLTAMGRGYGQWSHVHPVIWLHLLTILVALGLTPIILSGRRGDRLHRCLGWIWSASLFMTAIDSFLLRAPGGGFGIIHLLSVFTLIQVPVIIISARRHNVKRHRRAVRGMVTGALLIAGFFTFPFDRLLGHWLFS